MMKAILATAPGSADVLQLQKLAVPKLPGPLHLRVKLAAAGVNPVDTKLRAKPAYYPDRLPAILGCDGAGVVDAIGDEVSRFKVGDAVFFCNGGIGNEPGSYAEYTTLHEDYCALKPASLDFAEAAALPLVWITAWESLVERAGLHAGQRVLIHAGAGGVGHVAIQLAQRLGARVATTVSNDAKAGLVSEFGAEKIIRYREQDFVQAALDWTRGMGVDVVFDTVGGDTFLHSMRAVRIAGRIVSILATPLAAADIQLARLRNLSLCYDLMLTPQVLQLHEDRIRQRSILEQAAQFADAGKLRVVVSQRLPLEAAAQAHQLIERGGMTGKVVLTMD